jgi:2-oxoglutarate ferredoxin oxidoreductase subunit delta
MNPDLPEAPKKKEFDVHIYRRWCKDCGICTAFCPKKVFDANEFGSPTVAREPDCTGCMLCVYRCPDFALTVTKKEGKKDESENV